MTVKSFIISVVLKWETGMIMMIIIDNEKNCPQPDGHFVVQI